MIKRIERDRKRFDDIVRGKIKADLDDVRDDVVGVYQLMCG